MPNAASERGDVDFVTILWVRDDPLPPLEVEAGDARPVQSAIGGTPGRRFESSRVNDFWIGWINGDVVNVTVLIEDLLPVCAAVFG